MRLTLSRGVSRRQFLKSTAATGLVTLGSGLAMPYLSRAADRPALTHGVQSGDVSLDRAVLWARADRPAEMLVEVATTDSFKNARKLPAIAAVPETGLAAKIELDQLPAGQDIFYRIAFRDLGDINILSEPVVGRLRTAPADRRDVSFVWSGDTAGQGWGIDEARGGMTIYAAMLKHRPDFFLHSGDTVYADGAIAESVDLKDGTKWKNITTPEKSKVAETIEEFRGQWLYNMLDANVRAFNAQVPMLVQWDDHEVKNNWWPGQILDDERYQEKSIQRLRSRSARAFHEMNPISYTATEPGRVYRKVPYGPLLDVFFLDMRTYRGPNSENLHDKPGPETVFLGREQMAWLKRELTQSRATWKVIAADMPIGLIVADKLASGKAGSEAIAQGDGPVLGREFEIAELLSFIKHAGVRNTVWLTADVHYTAAHYYDPNKAQFQDFEPFWEFVSGPLHAGTFGPGKLDNTFGPQLRYVKAPTEEQGQNLPPSMGLQFFGHVAIDGDTGVMTVTLRDAADAALWSTQIEPQLG